MRQIRDRPLAGLLRRKPTCVLYRRKYACLQITSCRTTGHHVPATASFAAMSGAPLLPVLGSGTTVSSVGEHLPTVVIGTAEHPEVADLARVHAMEGMGDISTEAICVPLGDGHQLLLGIAVSVPVRCTFALGFALPAHRAVLDDAVAAGQLVLATTDPTRAADDQPHWLAITIDGPRLAAILPSETK
ncbi:MAG: hypothetical protein ACI88C_002571 [Acidimicrobiales bacterium]|jgi:hypothetical protein